MQELLEWLSHWNSGDCADLEDLANRSPQLCEPTMPGYPGTCLHALLAPYNKKIVGSQDVTTSQIETRLRAVCLQALFFQEAVGTFGSSAIQAFWMKRLYLKPLFSTWLWDVEKVISHPFPICIHQASICAHAHTGTYTHIHVSKPSSAAARGQLCTWQSQEDPGQKLDTNKTCTPMRPRKMKTGIKQGLLNYTC